VRALEKTYPAEHFGGGAPAIPLGRTRPALRLVHEAGASDSLWFTVARRAALVSLVVTGGVYIGWRPSTIRGTGALGVGFFIAEAATYLFAALTVVLLWRIRRRPGPGAPPAGTLDVYIPVCGEPVEMVEKTLKAALAIDYPHRTYLLNDGLWARKPGWRAIDKLAKRYDVPLIRRQSGAKRKAANLNYALKRTRGEFIAIIDADHCADARFAHETLGYFADERIAFVSTRQRFDGPGSDVLGNNELLFYRSIQPAKDAGNAAFSTGNAAVYRRAALQDIGGFSEWNVVEDLHTSYELHAHGWKSAYHPRPVTTGIAPKTAATLAKQRLQWSTDTLRVFLWDNPLFKRGLSPIQRIHYWHTTGYYLFALAQLLFLAGPMLHLLWGVSIMRPPSMQIYLTFAVPYLTSVAAFLLLHGGLQGALRSAQAGMFLAPIYLLGAIGAVTRIRFRMRVTDKAHERRWSMWLLPHVIAMAASIAGIVWAAAGKRPYAAVSVFWAGWVVFTLAGLVGTLSTKARSARVIRAMVRVPVVVLAAVTILFPPDIGAPSFDPALVVTQREPVAAIAPITPGPAARIAGVRVERSGALAPSPDGIYFGVFNPDLVQRSGAIRAWNAAHGVEAAIVNWYQQWGSNETRYPTGWIAEARSAGATPLITWEPWAKPEGSVHDQSQPDYSHATIVAGRHDAYIRSWARAAASDGRPVLLRFMHEMNGDWYPWSIRTNGNSPSSYRAAWQHVHDIFTAEGATNVTWVWTINTFAGMSKDNKHLPSYYPGNAYVDWVSMTGFNWGRSYSWNAWAPADYVFKKSYWALAKLRKPVMISEIATVEKGGSAAGWIRDALATIKGYPAVKAIVWFDGRYDRQVNFQLRGDAATALRDELRRDAAINVPLVFSEPRATAPAHSRRSPATSFANRIPYSSRTR